MCHSGATTAGAVGVGQRSSPAAPPHALHPLPRRAHRAHTSVTRSVARPASSTLPLLAPPSGACTLLLPRVFSAAPRDWAPTQTGAALTPRRPPHCRLLSRLPPLPPPPRLPPCVATARGCPLCVLFPSSTPNLPQRALWLTSDVPFVAGPLSLVRTSISAAKVRHLTSPPLPLLF